MTIHRMLSYTFPIILKEKYNKANKKITVPTFVFIYLRALVVGVLSLRIAENPKSITLIGAP